VRAIKIDTAVYSHSKRKFIFLPQLRIRILCSMCVVSFVARHSFENAYADPEPSEKNNFSPCWLDSERVLPKCWLFELV
jgi:hypothetical protein